MSLPVAEVIVLLEIVKILFTFNVPLVLKTPDVVMLPSEELIIILSPTVIFANIFTVDADNSKSSVELILVAVIALQVIVGAVKIPVTEAEPNVEESPVN